VWVIEDPHYATAHPKQPHSNFTSEFKFNVSSENPNKNSMKIPT
jgi:hypothetical protein